MRVALDLQLAVGTSTGIGEYARGLAAALRATDTEVCELANPRLDPWRFDRRVRWDQIELPAQLRRSGADLLHATSGTMPYRARVPVVTTVHDLAWLRVQGHTRPYARWYFGTFMRECYRTAAAIVVDSDFTRTEYLELVGGDPARVHVVYPGVDPVFAALERVRVERPFALALGTVEARKNLLRAIETVAAIDGLRLISVGPPTPYLDVCRARVIELGIADRVEFRGYVERSELIRLHAEAAVALAPSRYEGFGYAAAQALCAGIPLVAAATSSLIEVTGRAGTLCDPDDSAAWIDATRAALQASDVPTRAQRRIAAERFAWSTTAAACSAIYRSVL
jgi:glycosyltransferase involved in cell wall biosynthesis